MEIFKQCGISNFSFPETFDFSKLDNNTSILQLHYK